MKLTLSQRLSGFVPDPPPKLPPVGSHSGMTLDDWRDSVEHIVYARELFIQPKFRDLLAVLNNARPHASVEDISPTEANIMLGRREGFDMLIGLLMSLVHIKPKPQEHIEADYSNDDNVTS